MRMLQCMCRVTKLDKIRNERMRGTTKVGEITKKVQERRLKWYGHVMRREEHYVGRRATVMKVQGRRKRGVWHCTSTPHKSGNKMKEKKSLNSNRTKHNDSGVNASQCKNPVLTIEQN